MCDFTRIALTKVVSERGLPFEMKVPNRLTTETLAKSERGEDLHRAKDADAMFDELGSDVKSLILRTKHT